MVTLLHRDLTETILKAFYEVYNELGFGFLEKVYENSLCLELQHMGLSVETQRPIIVRYKGKPVGEYYADIVVDQRVIVELKAVERIMEAHESQLINYLKATGFNVGLVLNFGKKPEFSRKVYGHSARAQS